VKPVGNELILASAGAGKTFALTNRFVRLLAEGVPPERIAALTFTRKAAGEFFDEILMKLARAAATAGEATVLARAIGRPSLVSSDFRSLLRRMLASMPRLNLGTLDGFFARIASAFPLELGLSGAVEILDAPSGRVERRRILRRMFSCGRDGPSPAQKAFIEAFKRATFGVDEKRIGGRLDVYLDDHAEAYREAPDAAAWGNARRLWPDGSLWQIGCSKFERAAEDVRTAFAGLGLNEAQRSRLERFLGEVIQWRPGSDLAPLKYLLDNAFKSWPALGSLMLERRRVDLSPAASAALRTLLLGIGGAEIGRRLEMTRGIHAILSGYEAVYDGQVRRGGRLTFADLLRLLRPDIPGGAPPLAQGPAEGLAEARLFIDWRLDARIDHWLLDEFQDTSFGQWSVLRNLIDEAVQDADGGRSFFYVGDVKQAIFTWRGGDPRLFREIYEHYNAAAPGTIAESHLVRSFRSCDEVVGLVNRVFGAEEAWRQLLPGDVVDRWSRDWRAHESARTGSSGFAVLRHADGEKGRFAATLAVVRETGALERGLEVAVLVRTNDTAAAVADYLRREGGLPAIAESDLRVAFDNPLTCALMALFRAAAHPGDTAAREHVRMTPIEGLLEREGIAGPDALSARLLGQIHAGGFEHAVEAWLRLTEPLLDPEDAFSRERGRRFAEGARLFDATGLRDVAEFVEFMRDHTARDGEPAATVRVMTIHQSKGLGFDVVVLPDLEGRRIDQRRRGLAVERNRARGVEWVMDLPPQPFLDADPVMRAHVESAASDAAYESLCLLYVAMTRAKQALYLITEPSEGLTPNYPNLLRATLGSDGSEGDPNWHRSVTLAGEGSGGSEDLPPESVPGVSETRLVAAPAAVRRPARRPSERRTGGVDAASRFVLEEGGDAAFGREVHRLLAQIEWADSAETAARRGAWAARGEAGAEAEGALASPELAGVWARPSGPSPEAWRERAFEVVIAGEWVTGVFDRVVIERDGTGRPARAFVYDFKTGGAGTPDGPEEEAVRHRAQVGLYRLAAAALAGIPLDRVRAELVFTRLKRLTGAAGA